MNKFDTYRVYFFFTISVERNDGKNGKENDTETDWELLGKLALGFVSLSFVIFCIFAYVKFVDKKK